MTLYGKESVNGERKSPRVMLIPDNPRGIGDAHSISGPGRKLCQALLLSLMVVCGLPSAQAANQETAAPVAVDTTVSLNNAGAEELQTLDGVGPKTAASIVAWREREGPFKSVDQLMAVKGIGEKTLSRIRDRLSL